MTDTVLHTVRSVVPLKAGMREGRFEIVMIKVTGETSPCGIFCLTGIISIEQSENAVFCDPAGASCKLGTAGTNKCHWSTGAFELSHLQATTEHRVSQL